MADWKSRMEAVVAPAVARSQSIAEIVVDGGALDRAPALYTRHYTGPAFIVADENTLAAAGRALEARLKGEGIETATHILPAEPKPKPTHALATDLEARLAAQGGTPVSVGSGVINDLVKHAAFSLGKPYFCVATAASMDGYSSAGAPLVVEGFKKTIQCAPPTAILADLDIVCAAPPAMAGWGYGDLAGKVSAGADWIVADALGLEPIDDLAWPLVQDNLRDWLSGPDAVARGDRAATAGLFAGLTVAGLAMEFHGSSRPASGADHQIAHLWEMEGLEHRGERVAHGACVAIATLASLRLYDWLLDQDLSGVDIARTAARHPSLETELAVIERSFADPSIAEKAKEEFARKALAPDALPDRLETVRTAWPALRHRLRGHLMGADEMAALLGAAGAPVEPADIGIDAPKLKATVAAARYLRARYTILDLLHETGLLDRAIAEALSG